MARCSMVPEPCPILAARQLTEREVHFVVKTPASGFDALPGQFVMVSLPGIGEAPISLAALPGEGAPEGSFELCIRRTGRLTNVLTRLAAGDTIYVRGPYGRRVEWDAFEGNDLLFLAGGLGLAPLRAFIQRALLRRDRFHRIVVLIGARQPSELLFREDIERWRSRDDDVRVEVTVDVATSGWDGRVGVITTLLDDLDLDTERTSAFICGPPVMYRHVVRRLLAYGLYESHLWMTLERRMKCGIGLCGNCQMSGLYVCQEGPLFNYREVRHLREAI